MANYIAEVAKMLGVEIGENFKIIDCFGNKSSDAYYFTDTDLMINYRYSSRAESSILYNLIVGNYTIERKPWKPERGETYWYVEKDGDIWEREWHPCRYMSDHVNRYKLGNCYRTRGEAEANRDKWVAFYASDEVLEV